MIFESSVSVNASFPLNESLRTSRSLASQLTSCATEVLGETVTRRAQPSNERARVSPRCISLRVFDPTLRPARLSCQGAEAHGPRLATERVSCAGLRVAPYRK